ITQAGSATEVRTVAADAFTFRNEQLTPRVSTASPNSGPVTGGTRVTIFGDGFQAPVQVLFGTAEARVITVEFAQIIVETPAARDTSDTGSGTVTGPVTITVRTIDSQTVTTLPGGFLYKAAIDITSFRPLLGPATGGTDVVIDGIGFLAPIDVTIAGVRATVLQVTGTRILARTGALPSSCASANGAVRVINVNNGDFEEFTDETFTYVPINPLITTVSPNPSVPGGNITVTVRDPGLGALGTSDIRFSVNGRTLIPSPDRIGAGNGLQDFDVTLPLTGFTFPTVACTTGGGLAGTQFGPTELPLTFNNLTNGCSASTTININPPSPNPCLSTPQPSVTTPAGGSCATPAPASVTGVGFPTTTTAPIVINNASESQPLNITSVTISGSNASEFRINPTSANNIAAGGSANFTLTFDPTTAGAKDAVVTFNTNSTTTPTLTVCVQATAAP
ncbi:MAG TPA: IPT/TIG domain-containing protein, partial [Thermoanaerobaculia bacterium]